MYNRFENTWIKSSEKFATQYIAAWLMACNKLNVRVDRKKFHKWLKTMGLSELEARHIINLTGTNDRELINSAKEFLSEDTEQE